MKLSTDIAEDPKEPEESGDPVRVAMKPLNASELSSYAETVEGLPELEKRMALMTAAYTQLRLSLGEIARSYISIKDNYIGGRIVGLDESVMDGARCIYDCRRMLGDERSHEDIRGES